MKTIAAILLALSTLAIAGPASAAASRAHILEFSYSQDYEGIGRHYTVGATVKGDADRVTVRGAGGRATTRLAGHLSPAGRDNHLWIVDDHAWIRALRADLQSDGAATVIVKAVADGSAVRKSCSMIYEPDPDFGDFAGGRCHRI
jgi:hypothetical protein